MLAGTDAEGIAERFAGCLRRYGRDLTVKGLSRRLLMTPEGVRKLLAGDAAPSAYTLQAAARAWGPQVLLETLLTDAEMTQHARVAQAWAATWTIMGTAPLPHPPQPQQQATGAQAA